MPGRLDNKVALITGAASGQGEAEAKLFAAEGARVAVTDITDGTAVASALGDRAIFVSLDVADAEQWGHAVELTVERFGRLDILINNAGIGFPPRPLEDEDPEHHRRLIDTNLNGVYLGMRAVITQMSAQRSGSIVNISSIDGLAGVAGMTSYAATKFAVTGMTKSVALEVGGRGIRVNSIHPGVISSPMVANTSAEIQARLKTILDRQPIPRMGTPEEVAYLALYLASDESSYCTGAQFVIDGGHLAGPFRDGFGPVD
jgi:3alpha(or 20beta)-hydroxysteroid dehydrogenase